MIIKLIFVLVAVYSIVKITDLMEYLDTTRKARKMNKIAVSNNTAPDDYFRSRGRRSLRHHRE